MDKWKITGWNFSGQYTIIYIEAFGGIFNLTSEIQSQAPNMDINRIHKIERIPNEDQ
jgi:hypothetical protein